METTLKQRKLILDLVRQDLISHRWTKLLFRAELSMSESYAMNIDQIIFDQLELDEHPDIDEIYENYMKLLDQVMGVENLNEALTKLSTEICDYLESVIQK
jgi:GTP1/Obg family GTP-binding protein